MWLQILKNAFTKCLLHTAEDNYYIIKIQDRSNKTPVFIFNFDIIDEMVH